MKRTFRYVLAGGGKDTIQNRKDKKIIDYSGETDRSDVVMLRKIILIIPVNYATDYREE